MVPRLLTARIYQVPSTPQGSMYISGSKQNEPIERAGPQQIMKYPCVPTYEQLGQIVLQHLDNLPTHLGTLGCHLQCHHGAGDPHGVDTTFPIHALERMALGPHSQHLSYPVSNWRYRQPVIMKNDSSNRQARADNFLLSSSHRMLCLWGSS